ncbi:MAG: tRNA (adenosine(37)-N6)-threonylcarbamoyltransferase complex transferase subunit TsaD [Verrucomicrobia bacterium]|jgi:N6-L-threonylcarbamoyladenine synthase|nr:tRNA (adenosine(37)-N6)-threonylcarbamoyltransferase complex transferase subunit TsaD [Verrucomicrobiota bacterium]
MTLLAFETSCDETSAAVVHAGQVLSNVVSSQVGLHAEYGGVVPELAAREHLRNLIPVAQTALREASVTVGQLDAVAATQGPGLPSALMVGFKAAQALAFALRKPFVGIHHHEAHLYSPWIRSSGPPNPVGTRSTASPFLRQEIRDAGGTRPYQERMWGHNEGTLRSFFFADFDAFQPNVSLIVSGGHTMLVHVKAELNHRVLGSTVDDAAGECFDKTGKLMGIAYPAGAEIDRLAEQGNPKAFDFPRPMLHDANDDFSFSGLKTSVRYFLRDNPCRLDDLQQIRDLCASVQAAIVEVLVTKTIRAARRLGVRCVTASGGVTCNSALRKALGVACAREGFTLRLAEQSLCTDNGAMIGILAERKLLTGGTGSSLDAEIAPGMQLA